MKPPRIDHIGIVVDELEPAITAMARMLPGAPLHRRSLPEAGLEVAEFHAENLIVELLRYTDGGDGFGRAVMGSAAGVNHLSLSVADLDAALAQLHAEGLEPLAGFPRRGAHGRIAFLPREAVQNKHQLDAFTAIGAGYVGPIPIPVILAAVIFVLGYVALRFTLFGRYLYAVGANQKAARLSGLRAERLKVIAFVITGLCVGVAGLVLCSLMNAGQPTAGRGFELTVIAAVILGGTSLAGGRGTLVGTLLGVLLLKVIDNGIIILRWNQDLQMVVPGIVIVLATWLDIIRRKADAR